MSFNNNQNFSSNPANAIGLPSLGYGNRGKATGLKRLSVASPPKLGALDENQVDDSVPTPRTSRSYLLAGLRTAPKTPSGVPASAPYNQTQHAGLDSSRYSYQNQQGMNQQRHQQAPQTSVGNHFPMQQQQYGIAPGQQFYALPEQVLAPPSLEIDDSVEDPQFAAMYHKQQMLALRQQMLQQQLANLTGNFSAGLNLNQQHRQQMYPQTPVTPQQMNMYNQQLLQGMQPVVQEVPGHPGIYLVYNPLTGQTTYAADPSSQEAPQLANSPPPPTPSHTVTGFNMDTPSFRAQVSPPSIERHSPFPSRSISPPKKTPSPPANVEPLPPPSANAFRRGHHKKVSSLGLNNPTIITDGPKSAYLPRTVGVPPTPLTGTFGPGQGRAGEHAMRQPRGPPAIEELKEKPTTKFDGSKNFATRQRRQALSSLVRAGLERRVRPGSGSNGSMTPVSETELTFSIPSDNDSDSGRSLSGKQSIGSLRAAAHGAIGGERKSMSPVSSEDGRPFEQRRIRTPLLALANAAEKRRSVNF
ncbi:hypothetical protein EG327_000165 [Venturia inaequalis]|uniref:Uncharacterized protein n=1 Tax=Venturia inaequalis TaxID=5025 RepID=A0A8H3YMR2_VENIN|nr:hypothetical protein EG327_000165 [Venturia inaequalis]